MKNIMNINGIEYDIKNVDDREILKSMGYIDRDGGIIKNVEEVGESVGEREDEYINCIDDKGGWNCPMNTEYINDKKMDYKTLGIMTYFSNRKGEEVCDMLGLDISEVEHHRYLYEKGNNSIWSNRKEIEQISENKLRTIKRNINKLVECGNDVVTACKDDNGNLYYKINPYAKNGDGIGKYVKIDSRMLKTLCNIGNSTCIKTYCTLIWLLTDDNGNFIERQLTYDFIAKQVGLSVSSKSCKSVHIIGDVTTSLRNNGFITKKDYFYINKKGERIKSFKYKLTTYEEFRCIFYGKN